MIAMTKIIIYPAAVINTTFLFWLAVFLGSACMTLGQAMLVFESLIALLVLTFGLVLVVFFVIYQYIVLFYCTTSVYLYTHGMHAN